MPSIEISQLEISYGSFRAVQDASFEADEGEMLGLLGPSGSGKTTILRSVAGLEDVTAGRIIIGGKCIVSPTEGHLHEARGPPSRDGVSSPTQSGRT